MAHLSNINVFNKMTTLQDNNQTKIEIIPKAKASTENPIIFYIAAGIIISAFVYVIIITFFPKLLVRCCRKCRRSAEDVPSRNELALFEQRPSTSGTLRVAVSRADLNACPYEGEFDTDDEQPPSLESVSESKDISSIGYVDVSGEQEEMSMKDIESIPSGEEIPAEEPAEK